MALPVLPNVPEKVKPRPHFAYIYLEPRVPKFVGTSIKLSPKDREDIEKAEAEERVQQVLQKGSMRRGVVIALPNDVDIKKFPMVHGDIVGVPVSQSGYDIINIDGIILHMVGLYDLSVLPDLTEEEAIKWTEDYKLYDELVVNPKKDTPVLPMHPKATDGAVYIAKPDPLFSPNRDN